MKVELVAHGGTLPASFARELGPGFAGAAVAVEVVAVEVVAVLGEVAAALGAAVEPEPAVEPLRLALAAHGGT